MTDINDDYLLDEEPNEPVKKEEVKSTYTQNINLEQSVYVTQTEDSKKQNYIALPSGFRSEVDSKMAEMGFDDPTLYEQGDDWIRTIAVGNTNVPFNDVFKDSLGREASEWQQHLRSGETMIRGGKVRLPDNTKLEGPRAALFVTQILSRGSLIRIPLYHTGIWITIRKPNPTAIIDLFKQLGQDKYEVGRNTYGLAFSNVSVMKARTIMEFCIEHIHQTTYRITDNISELLDVVKIQDMWLILNGLVAAMNPTGFNYKRGCINSTDSCNHIDEGRIDPLKLVWVDRTTITETMFAHLTRGTKNSIIQADLDRYQETLMVGKPKRFCLDEETKTYVTFKSPTISDYFKSGNEWLEGLIKLVEKALTESDNYRERNKWLFQYSQAQALRHYYHWVDSIEMDGKIANDPSTVKLMLEPLGSEDIVAENFMKLVTEFISNSAIAVVGIPIYECPVCGTTQEENNPIDPNMPPLLVPKNLQVIPLDLLSLFFDQAMNHYRRILQR